MSKLFIPVGLPGCGKSTFAERVMANMNFHIYSTDQIRERLTGDARTQTSNDQVFDLFHESIEDSLRYGANVYADATNLRDFARERLRKMSGYIAVTTHVLVFTNTAQAVERNLKRDRVVPPDVMVRFIAQFEQALRDIPSEGYDTVTYIKGVS